MSFQEVWASGQRKKGCYFWTLTPEGHMSDRLFSVCINRFLVRFDRMGLKQDFKAIRVYEPFQSGYLHCHFVCDKRLSVQMLRRVAWQTGIGRIHVRKAVSSDAGYLMKYLGKCRGKLGAGLRTWATWGDWSHTLVRNVEVTSPDTDLMRECYARARQEVRESRDNLTGEHQCYYVARIPSRQAYVNGRALFVREKLARMRAWTREELTPF